MHRMCDSLRTEHNKEIIEKWIKGETGFPFLDACMKFLNKHGWINFHESLSYTICHLAKNILAIS